MTDTVIVGRVGKPFGVQGDVYVFADPDLADALSAGTALQADDGRTLVVSQVRDHSGRMVVTFEGVHGRQGAESVRGLILSVDRAEFDLDDDMVWIDDLRGRQVVDATGDLVGVVESVTDGHAHDYLVVARPDGGRISLPMVEQIIDWDADPIVVTPPDGLLNPDEAW